MLTESFVASVLTLEKSSNNFINKDAGIHIYELQPQSSLKSSFKKSSTKANCLAVSASHVFAAQADKAVIHVYSRERGNQETLVPFPEKICSLALVGNPEGAGILALGTEGGRIILWELCTGRQVSTPNSHLQATTCLVVDPTFNFLLSGSPDSSIHIWSIPALLSFSSSTSNEPSRSSPFSPLRTLSNHRAEITCLIVGHSFSSTSIAISASRDNTCLVWDYRTGTLLHTYLLPTAPLCLTIDPVDRAFYAGYEDGSIQLISFYASASLTDSTYDPTLQATPTQPPSSSRWYPPGPSSPVLSIALSYDGTILLSGHHNGTILTWDIAKAAYSSQLTDFFSPITNIHMLPPVGFLNTLPPVLKINQVVKPRYENSFALGTSAQDVNEGSIPPGYSLTAQFASPLPIPRFPSLNDSFDTALTHPSFPPSLLEEGLCALSALSHPRSTTTTSSLLADDSTPTESESQALELATLRTQLSHARASQQVYTEKALELQEQVLRFQEESQERRARKRRRRGERAREDEARRKRIMGEIGGGKGAEVDSGTGGMSGIGGEEGEKGEGEESESSSTDELTGSE